MATNVTTWGHACVAFERDGRRLVIDPGAYSDPNALDQTVEAVLITHEHPDHLDVARVSGALQSSSSTQVWAPAEVVAQLVEAGTNTERAHAVADGDAFTAAGFAVQALGHDHARVHPDIPPVVNVAYLVDQVALHPGDSFTPAPAGTDLELLLLPVAAPWLALGQAIDYLRAAAPRTAVPIHDAILSDQGKLLVDRILGALPGATDYRRLGPAERLELARP
jgi:L-ascorbate metabolism protein UlaG (beta-lactamase superfamily)